MNNHRNARTMLFLRTMIVERQQSGESLEAIAAAFGVSVRTIYKRITRPRGPPGLRRLADQGGGATAPGLLNARSRDRRAAAPGALGGRAGSFIWTSRPWAGSQNRAAASPISAREIRSNALIRNAFMSPSITPPGWLMSKSCRIRSVPRRPAGQLLKKRHSGIVRRSPPPLPL